MITVTMHETSVRISSTCIKKFPTIPELGNYHFLAYPFQFTIHLIALTFDAINTELLSMPLNKQQA